MKNCSSILFAIFLAINFCYADVDSQSIPLKIQGALDDQKSAEKALSYFGARVSKLAPCGDHSIKYWRKGEQWLALEVVVGNVTKRVSWRIWQLNAKNAELIDVQESEWEFDGRDCKST